MKKIKVIIIVIIIAVLIIIYAMFIGTSGLITKEYTIYYKNLPASYNGLKIVHFSDLHYGSIIKNKRLKKIVEEINIINPDIVIFTGDLFERKTNITDTVIKDVSKNLKNIKAKYGKYAILGNHDYEEGIEIVTKILNDSNFTTLNNNYDIIKNAQEEQIYIGGLDDTLLGNADITKTTTYLNENEQIFSIMLVHEPDYTDTILKHNKIDLILAGHSHDGQVKLPFIGALYTPNGSKKYYKNHYQINDTNLYISSGIGNSKLNIRLFNRPSINFYRLNKKDS